MKAKELIKILELNPEYEITTSIDAFDITGKEDKIYGEDIAETIVDNSTQNITLLFEKCNVNFKIKR